MKYIKDEETYILTRQWNRIDYDLLNNKIINSDKYFYMLTDSDPDRVTINLINEIQKHFNNVAPIIKVKINDDAKVKLSEETLCLIKKKNDSYKRMKLVKSVENISEFNILSKICHKKIIKEKNCLLQKNLSKETNPQKLWRSTKKHLYGSKNKTFNRIIENNTFVNGSLKVANILNRYFIRKPKIIVENLPENNIDPMEFYTKNVNKNINKFSLKPVNMSDIRRAMSSVNKSNSMDYYGINMKMLFKIRRAIEPIIMNVINISIYNSKFPEVLKINKIIPIPKDTDYLSPKNFRAINIFNPISKIIEKCWAFQIVKYLEENNYLKNNHQGGIKGRGTMTATLNLN